MPTLVFCTAYAASPSVWETRYRLWLDAVAALGADQVLLVDDGSATLPGWPELHVTTVDAVGEAFTVGVGGPGRLVHFRKRLGRLDTLNFPGWHRSFAFAALYAEANGFDRVIHLESDAFLISERANRFVAEFSDGWAALYASRFDMPEMAVQVAQGLGLRALAMFARQPYAALAGRVHERCLPFTHVERDLVGDRVDETEGGIPAHFDFAAQVPSRREASFYSWLPGRVRAPPAPHHVRWRLCEGGNGLAALGDGWAAPEPNHHWMLGGESTLSLPPLPGNGPAVLRLSVTPHVFEDKLTRQRLVLELNGTRLREFDIFLECILGCDIPAAALRADAANLLRLIHPDAQSPHDLSPALPDARRLSVSVAWVEVGR